MTSAHTSTPCTALLCGAHGLIGQALSAQLQSAGFKVLAASRRARPAINFADMTRANHWLPHLQGVDVVVNAVGSLRDQPGANGAPLKALHQASPQALFDACAQMMQMIHTLPQPVIAEVQGIATAAGCAANAASAAAIQPGATSQSPSTNCTNSGASSSASPALRARAAVKPSRMSSATTSAPSARAA